MPQAHRLVGIIGLVVVVANGALWILAANSAAWDLTGLVFVLSPVCNLTLAVALVALAIMQGRKVPGKDRRLNIAAGVLFPLMAAVAQWLQLFFA